MRSHAAVTTSLPRASFASDPDRSDTSTYVALRARIVAEDFDLTMLQIEMYSPLLEPPPFAGTRKDTSTAANVSKK